MAMDPLPLNDHFLAQRTYYVFSHVNQWKSIQYICTNLCFHLKMFALLFIACLALFSAAGHSNTDDVFVLSSRGRGFEWFE